MSVEFRPMRSVIYVDVCREEYRHRLQHWLYGHHIQDSISNFGPYVTKYAFYNALPVPPEGERFGTRRMQMTEHYWLVNEMEPEMRNKAIAEFQSKVRHSEAELQAAIQKAVRELATKDNPLSDD